MGTHPLPEKEGGASQFLAHVYCGQTAAWIKMPLGTEVGLGPVDIVRWGPARLSQKGVEPPPQFLDHVCCGQMAGWIKMALGMEVGLGPRHIVLDGDPAPLPKKGAVSPNFRPIFIVAKRLDASRYHLVWRKASAQATLC